MSKDRRRRVRAGARIIGVRRRLTALERRRDEFAGAPGVAPAFNVGRAYLWTVENVNRSPTAFTVPFKTSGGTIGNPELWEFDASNRIVLGRSGLYQLGIRAKLLGDGTGRQIVSFGIFANGSAIPVGFCLHPSNRTDAIASRPAGISFTVVEQLAAGDYLEVKTIGEGAGGDVVLAGSAARPEATIDMEWLYDA